jgi:hypothetical protein
MGLFGRKKATAADPSQMSPEDALRLAREGLAKTNTYFNGANQRRRLTDEQRAQMEAVFDKLEAANARAASSPPPEPEPEPNDTISKLERLASLHASGALTDEEFAAQKSRLLGS